MVDIGLKIQAARKAAKLTQFELAERIGISMRHLQRIESGQTNINLETLGLVAEALRLEVADLVANPKRKTEPSAPGTGRRIMQHGKSQPTYWAALTGALEFLQAFEQLPPTRKAFVLALVFRDESFLNGSSESDHHAYQDLAK